MNRSFIYLRRMLFAVSCAVVFGFGTTQALAMPAPELWNGLGCPVNPELQEPYYSDFCAQGCMEDVGYCGFDGQCHCGYY